jgi:uncharacterized protein
MKNLTGKIITMIALFATLIANSPLTDNPMNLTTAQSQTAYHFTQTSERFSTRAFTAPTQSELQTVASKSRSALSYLESFWTRAFSNSGRRFVVPGVIAMSEGKAFYSPKNHTIYFNPAFFVERMREAAAQTKTDGDMAFIVILAHEYGHAVQANLKLLGGDCKASELQADRMAGAFATAAREAGMIEAGDFDEATYTFFAGRDGTGQSSSCPHGSGTERVNAFHEGLKGGLKACFSR